MHFHSQQYCHLNLLNRVIFATQITWEDIELHGRFVGRRVLLQRGALFCSDAWEK